MTANVDAQDVDVKASVGGDLPDSSLNVGKPEIDIDGSGKLPVGDISGDIDLKGPDASEGIGFGLGGRKGSHSSDEGDHKDKKKKDKKGKGGFGFKMHMPKFGGSGKGDAKIHSPDADLDVKGDANICGGIDVNADPEIKTNTDVDVSVNSELPSAELPGVNSVDVALSTESEAANAPHVTIAGDTSLPELDIKASGSGQLGEPECDVSSNLNANADVGVQRSGSILDKIGAFFKKPKTKSYDSESEKKRGKKRKHDKDGGAKFYAPDVDTNVQVSGEANLKAPDRGSGVSCETDFVMVDTPCALNKDIEATVDVEADIKVSTPEVEAEMEVKTPKSPSLLRRIGMFFHIHSNEYDIEGKKKKKRRKTSSSNKTKIHSDSDTLNDSQLSMKKDEDNFTIPEANIVLPKINVKQETNANIDIPSVETKQEFNVESNISTGHDASSKVDVQVPNLDEDTNLELQGEASTNLQGSASTSAQATGDGNAGISGDLGSFKTELGGKSFEVKMSY